MELSLDYSVPAVNRKLSCSPLAEWEAGQLEFPKKDCYEPSGIEGNPARMSYKWKWLFPREETCALCFTHTKLGGLKPCAGGGVLGLAASGSGGKTVGCTEQ